MQLSTSAHIDGEVVNIIPQTGPDVPDISEFKFSKFAAMYFQNNASHAYIRRALKHPLLPLRNEGDQLVSASPCTGTPALPFSCSHSSYRNDEGAGIV